MHFQSTTQIKTINIRNFLACNQPRIHDAVCVCGLISTLKTKKLVVPPKLQGDPSIEFQLPNVEGKNMKDHIIRNMEHFSCQWGGLEFVRERLRVGRFLLGWRRWTSQQNCGESSSSQNTDNYWSCANQTWTPQKQCFWEQPIGQILRTEDHVFSDTVLCGF